MQVTIRRPKNWFVWWLNPVALLGVTLLPLSIAAYCIPNAEYVENWKANSYFGTTELALMFAIFAAFTFGAIVSNSMKSPQRISVQGSAEELPWQLIYRFFLVGFVLSVTGYLIWLALCFANGLTLQMLVSVLKGEEGSIFITRDLGGEALLPGVTTITQFEMAVSILGTLIGWRFGWRKTGWHLATLALMAFVRAIFFCERLAFLEFVLPGAILLLRLKLGEELTMRTRKLLSLLPVVSVLALFALFTVTEYFRSWANMGGSHNESIIFHSWMRLLGYYVTALNNGALYFQTIGVLKLPYNNLEWFWKFPLMSFIWKSSSDYIHDMNDHYELMLKHDANLEFNNPSGTFVSFLDFGIIGGLLMWVVAGAVGMALYRSFKRGTAGGILFYPFYFIGLTETARISYWGASRAFPTWIYLLLIFFLVRAQPKRTPLRAAEPVISPVTSV